MALWAAGLTGLFLLGLVGCSSPRIKWDGSARPQIDGETRALVIWARFVDDSRDLRQAPTQAQREWASPDQLPRLAGEVLSASSRHPRGLTEYFLSQSQGKFKLTGRSYPQVIVSRLPEASYRAPNGTLDQGRFTKELLERIDADKRFELDDFDADHDGFIDYVFIVVRGMSATRLYPSHASGVSDLGYTSELPEFGRRKTLKLDRHQSGSYLRYDDAGNIFARIDLVRLMAHEIGHDLWTDWVHLRPLLPSRGVPPFASRQVGYALMAGGSDARGDETISAFERDQLDWITCSGLSADTVVVLRDLYTGGSDNCVTMPGPQFRLRGDPRTLYLSYRERIGPFDKLVHEDAPQARSDQGLMDTGLLVMVTEPSGRVGPVPADGDLALSPHAARYRGDLFQAGDRLTPWTTPNSSGFLGFPAEISEMPASAWQGLHFVRQEAASMTVRYTRDERQNASFKDGDVISALPELSFSGVATATGRVSILGDAEFQDSLRVEAGSTLTIQGRVNASHLALRDGSILRVEGSLEVPEVTINPGASVIISINASLRGAASAVLRAAGTTEN